MYYDDATRRYNFLAGLALGAVLGAGVGLLLSSQDRVPARPALARSPRRLRRRTLGHLRGMLDADR